VGAELLHADGQTDRTKIIVAFRNPANAQIAVLTLKASFFIYAFDKDVPHRATGALLAPDLSVCSLIVD